MHYGYLLDDHQIRRWHDNVGGGSLITADVYLRRLGGFLEGKKLQYRDLLSMDQGKRFDLLLDTVSEMEKQGYAGGYTESVLKAVKSWLQFNNITLIGKIKIRGVAETPTLVNEQVPSQAELQRKSPEEE